MTHKTILVPGTDPGALQRAADLVRGGGLIAFPTDTVYGIGVSAFDPAAVDRIYQVKGRSQNKAIPILLGDPEELDRVASSPAPCTADIIREFWPGALTLVLPKDPALPANLSAAPTIGVRVPDFELTRKLLRLTGPLAATSANLSGQPSALTASEVLEQLDGKIDLVLDGGASPGGQASTVLDCSGEKPQILREGPITREQIDRLLDLG